MVQGGVFFPQSPGLDAGRLRLADKLLPQVSIILDIQPGLGCAEGRHVARRPLAGGDVEVVCIHDGMGGGDDQHLRRPCRRLLCGGAVGVDGGLNIYFPPTAHSWDDDGRVGDDNGVRNTHIIVTLTACFCRTFYRTRTFPCIAQDCREKVLLGLSNLPHNSHFLEVWFS